MSADRHDCPGRTTDSCDCGCAKSDTSRLQRTLQRATASDEATTFELSKVTYVISPVKRIVRSNEKFNSENMEGSAVLDSATSYLLRIDFRLANLDPRKRLTQLDGYQTFTSPSPFVIMPDSVVAIWWTRKKTEDDPNWAETPDFAQSLHIEGLKYRKRTPPGYQAPKQ